MKWLYWIGEQSSAINIKNWGELANKMTRNLYIVESHKFTNDNVEATFVCPKCDEVFIKDFPLDLEGQIIEFKCPVCRSSNEADLPYKQIDKRENLEAYITDIEEEGDEEFNDD